MCTFPCKGMSGNRPGVCLITVMLTKVLTISLIINIKLKLVEPCKDSVLATSKISS